MSKKPITSRQNAKGFGILGGLLFGGCFFSFGSIALIVIVIMMVIPVMSAQKWESTQCTILTSRVETHHGGDDGPSYSPEITFKWTVDGKQHSGGRYWVTDFSSNHSWAKGVVDDYPVGKKTECFYDPEKPSDAVLNRDIGWFTFLIPIIPLIFMCVGGAIMFFTFRGRKETSETSQILSPGKDSGYAPDLMTGAEAAKNARTQHPDDVKDAEWSKPQQLKPAQTRLGNAIGMFFFALIWNGIVSMFLYFMLTEPPNGWEKYLIWAILTPFVLVGLFLILAMISSFMQLFNPVVEVALSSGAIPVGGSVDLAWEVTGRVGAIRKLTIKVSGTESATYRRGTSTYTDHSKFQAITVVEVVQQHEMQFGSVQLSIPADTMHTADFGNNKINWTIEVHGDIAFWPDITESYPFRVTPA